MKPYPLFVLASWGSLIIGIYFFLGKNFFPYKKIIKFIKGFTVFNIIFGAILFWLFSSVFLAVGGLTSYSFDISDFYWILKGVFGLLFIFGLPGGISFGFYNMKNNKDENIKKN